MKSALHFHVLNDDEISEIKNAAFSILKKIGCDIRHKEARDLLEKRGASISGNIVKVPEELIEHCINQAPKGFTIYDRLGKPKLDLKDKNFYYGTSTASPNTRDPITAEIRKTAIEDIAFNAKLADALANIDWVMPMGSAQNVPAKAGGMYEFEAVVKHTVKPIVSINYSYLDAKYTIEMAAEVRGGYDKLKEKPFIITYPEPIAPLTYPEESIDKMFVAADCFVPQVPGSTVQPGATGPVTIAGSVAQLIAEGLMNIVLTQVRNPGSPCFLAGNLNIFDMNTTLMSIAAPEMSLGTIAYSEVAQSWGFPTWGLAGSSDSKLLDAQAGAESAFSILAQGLGGVNLIHDVGYLDMAMVCSAEMLVLGDEIVGMVRQMANSFEVNDETLALDVIEKVGPGGNYLKQRHTVKHYRNALWMPSIFTREHINRWKKSGEKPIDAVIREKIIEVMKKHTPIPLDEDIIERMNEIKSDGVAEILCQ